MDLVSSHRLYLPVILESYWSALEEVKRCVLDMMHTVHIVYLYHLENKEDQPMTPATKFAFRCFYVFGNDDSSVPSSPFSSKEKHGLVEFDKFSPVEQTASESAGAAVD